MNQTQKIVFAVIITAIVVGGGMYWWQSAQVSQLNTELKNTVTDETSVASSQVVKYNCEQSGGSYSNSACSCSDGEYEQSTGYCITATGSPGGELQKEAAKLQELVMLKNTIEQQSNLKNYSSAKYSFKYPSNYLLEENFGVKQQEGTPLKILSVKGTAGRIEIFRMSDFGDRPWGFEPEEGQEEISQKEIDGYVPKETLTVGSGENKYDVWLFYSDNDETTKSELKSIFGSIEIR